MNIDQARGQRILLFVQDRHLPSNQAAAAHAQAIAWPEDRVPEVVDILESDELARWYGIVQFPAIVVVDQGMIVEIEHECTPEACERLIRAAKTRAPMLRERDV